jgi:hypothetical protein
VPLAWEGTQAAASPPRRMEQQALATFLAPVEHRHFAPRGLAVRKPGQDRRFAAALVSGLTVAALAIHGYHPFAEDGGLYLAGIERLLNPALFPHSMAFVLEPSRYSLFAAAVAAIVRLSHLGLPVILLGLHLTSIWATLFAFWMLACRCWPDRAARAGAVTLLACWLSLPVAGTALALMDPYLTARSISTPCMVLALVGMLDATERHAGRDYRNTRIRGILLWFVSIAIAASMHPLMAAYACAATVLLASVRSRSRRVRLWGTGALAAIALAIAAYSESIAKPETAEYRRIALTRTYWFPALWNWYEILGLVAPLVILVAFAMRTSSRTAQFKTPDAERSLCCVAIAAGSTAWLAAACLARTMAANYFVARLQPLRIFQIVYFVMVLMLGAMLGRWLLSDRLGRWTAAMLLLGGIMFTTERHAFPDSPHLELPRSAARNPWVEAFLWIRSNTPQDALFALDPDYINAPGEDAQCFRAITERSALPDYSKDGGEASIAPELTAAWTSGQHAQHGLNATSTTDATRIAALEPFGVSWIVLDAQTPTLLHCPYTNSAVKVCRLAEPARDQPGSRPAA